MWVGRGVLQAEERDAPAMVQQDDSASCQKMICGKLRAELAAVVEGKGDTILMSALPWDRRLASDESIVGRVPIELSLDVVHPERDGH
ncbi:MAG: hypothetical protein ABJC10_04940 [Acidobacteriota bacterium]